MTFSIAVFRAVAQAIKTLSVGRLRPTSAWTNSRRRPTIGLTLSTTEIAHATTTMNVGGQGKLVMSSVKTPNEVISAYRPTVISKDRWQTIAPFVREQVTSAADPNWTPDQTRNALRIVTRFVDYASITGRPLTVESVFIDSLVTAFVHHELDYTTHVKGSARATLRAVAKAVNPDFDGPRNTPEYGTDKKLAPYTPQDVAALRQWAAGETTQERRDQAELLLAFGLGAGLRACEVATLTDQDVEVDEHGVVLHPSGYRGASKRFVPVETEWSEAIMRAVRSAKTSGSWLFRPRRTSATTGVISLFTKRSAHPANAVDLGRARTTWVVKQVAKGVPESAVCEAAGLADLQHYRAFLLSNEHTTAREARSLLHGGPNRLTGRGQLTVIRGGA